MHTRIPVTTSKHKTLRADASGFVVACAGVNNRLPACGITQFLEREMVGSGLTVAQLGTMTQIAGAPQIDDGRTGAWEQPRTIDAFAQFAYARSRSADRDSDGS
jgi:hypothetical protein